MLWLMKLSHLFRRLLTAAVLFSSTVSHATVVERPVSPVSLGSTLTDAHKVATRHGDMQVLRIAGNSMLPFFGDGSVVVVKKIEAAQLREGMVVVYQNRFGETVAHRLIAQNNAGWVAQGYNNAAADTTLVSDANLMGVVYATFHSNGDLGAGSALAALAANTQVAMAAPAK
jgi:signal peptidase I